MQVTIYGAGDDLIEVEGDLQEEFSGYDVPKMLLFSDGTQLRIEYTEEGIWRITDVKVKASVVLMHSLGSDAESEDYSDRLTLEGDWQWVECWPVGGPTSEALVDWLDEYDVRECECANDVESLLTIYRLCVAHKPPHNT